MTTGFFVELTERRAGFRTPVPGKPWIGNAVSPPRGWAQTSASGIDEVLRLQVEQYFRRKRAGLPVPDLVSSCDGPIASGRMVRFASIENLEFTVPYELYNGCPPSPRHLQDR
ncbi:MAG: hypothetical protein JWO78_1647 [Micavibrio sp.]|nr:hypothetical protein [Micavibrio sp.]